MIYKLFKLKIDSLYRRMGACSVHTSVYLPFRLFSIEGNFRYKFYLLVLLPFFGGISIYPITAKKSKSLETLEWPIYGHKVIDTHLYSWDKSFFAINVDNEIVHITFPNGKLQRKKKYEYSGSPDIIKHFTLQSGSLFVAIFKEAQRIQLTGVSSKGRLTYDTSFNVDINIELADIRINKEGAPLCLFYYKEKRNYAIGLWEAGVLKDIYRIQYPIDYIFFQWETKTVHMLHQLDNHYYWSVWSKQYYYQLKLPFHILAPSFFSIGHRVFLMGIELVGTLWKFSVNYDKLVSAKIASNPELRYTNQIVPVIHQKRLKLFMPNIAFNKVWRVQFNNFFKNTRAGALSSNNLFLGEKVHFLTYQSGLYMLMETDKRHLYLQSWNSQKLHLYNFRWKISLKKPPSLTISWDKSTPGKYLYEYLLDNKDDSEPIGEPTSFPNERIKITNVQDGHHVFHLRVVDSNTKKKSYLYHLPIFWLYEPPEPRVIFLNAVSPSTFLPGLIQFYIRNQLPIEYYAKISQQPKDKPDQRLNIQRGIISLNANLKIGWYYLHIRARDPNTKKQSTIMHIPFAIRPYDPNIERLDAKTDTTRTSLEELKKSVIKNKDDLAKLKNIREQLEKFKQEVAE